MIATIYFFHHALFRPVLRMVCRLVLQLGMYYSILIYSYETFASVYSFRISELNSIRDDINSSSFGNSLFDNTLQSNKNAFSLQSLQNQTNSDVGRLTTELMTKNAQMVKLSSRIDETSRKVSY